MVVVVALYVASLVTAAENMTAAQLLPKPSYHGGATTYNAKNYGAMGNGANDDTKALMAAWKVACGASGTVTLMIPPGTYYIGPTQFHGPCKASALTFLLQGTLKAATDLKRFGNDWIEFGWVKDLTVVGQNGIIDGQGAASWPFNKCPIQKDCKVLPTVSPVSLQGMQPHPERSVREQPEHGGARHHVREQQVLPHRAAAEQQHEDDQPPDQRARRQPEHGRHPHRAQHGRGDRRHPHRHGRRLHLHRPGERQHRHRPRPLRPGPRHERRQPWTLRRRGRRHPCPRQGHDLRGHDERRPDQDVGELPHGEPRRAHGVREHGDEGRAEPHHHRPEVLPLLQLRAQVRLGGDHQGRHVQEHQGHVIAARGGAAPVRCPVPRRGAGGRRPQVQGTGRHLLKVRERHGQVRRLPVPRTMHVACSGGCTGAGASRFLFLFSSN